MKYYLIAGEASGDLHGANLVRALKQEDSAATFRGWGGDLMAAAGTAVVKHYRELAFMGFWEVIKNLPAILKNFRECKRDLLHYQPDVLILIDYPGFNLRMAKWAKRQQIRVFYYISPQLWAWHTSRVKIVQDCVERMYVIFPFEKEFYEKYGVSVEYVGHPLLDAVQKQEKKSDFFQKNNLPEDKPIVALLPGSRRQEISRTLQTMASLAIHFPEYQFVVAGAPSIELEFYRQLLPADTQLRILENQTHTLLQFALAAIVTSGTATLETALSNVAQVVCYQGGRISFWLAKRLVNKELKFIAIVNLIAGKAIVKELIQNDFTIANLREELQKMMLDEHRQAILSGYRELRQKLGGAGASHRAAASMVQFLKKDTSNSPL